MITATLVLLMTSSLVTGAIENYNPNAGTTSTVPSYMTASNSAQTAAAKYGDLLQKAYEWWDPWGNNPERTGFNPGPAPDRPDVLFRTDSGNPIPKVYLGSALAADVNAPFVDTMSQAVIGFGGQIFLGASIRVNATNSTTRTALVSLNPFTGAVNWASIVGFGPTTGATLSTTIFRVDDTHIATLGGSGITAGMVCMWTTDGKFLWKDSTMNPGSVYRAAICVPAPVYKIMGAYTPSTTVAPGVSGMVKWLGCWDLSSPDVDKNTYNSTGAQISGGRSLWNYTIDESGDAPMMVYGDGMVFMGSYSANAIFAVNVTTGQRVWGNHVVGAIGYTGAYADGKVFVGCENQHVYAFNGTTGEIIWRNDDGVANRAWNVYDFNVAYGRVYTHDLGFGRTGAQKCFDAETGKLLWAATQLHSIGYYLTVVGDGKIYGEQADASTYTGRLPDPVSFRCWDAFTGEVIWELRMSISTPTLVYGCLYFVSGSQLWALSTAAAPQDWSMWRGNVETPGFTLDNGPSDISGGPKWTFTTGGSIISSPVVADGKAYVTSGDRYVYCIDAYNGSLIWRFLTNEPKMTSFGSTPAVYGGKVFIGPDDGNMYCLDANTGAKLWSITMGTYIAAGRIGGIGQHPLRSSPIIYNGLIYVGSLHNNKTYCVDMSGNVKWSTDLASIVIGSAAAAGGYIYMMNGAGRMYKLNAGTGAIVWNITFTTASSLYAYTPTVVGDYIWIGRMGTTVACHNATDGSLIYNVGQGSRTSGNTHGGLVYVPSWALTARNATNGTTFTTNTIIGQYGPEVACSRADNGSVIWRDWTGWEVWSTVFSGFGNNARIYFGTDSYAVQVVNASTGTPISWFTTGSNVHGTPAIWDGKMYITSDDNKLYCFEDHPTQEMAMSMSLDKTTVDLNNTESVTVTAQLTHVPSDNPYEEIGRAAPVPPLPNSPIIVTFTKPDGTEVNVTATTDLNGWATVTYTPNAKGTWKVIAWYAGIDLPTTSYGYAFSDQVPIEAAYTITEPKGPTPPPGTNIPMEYVYAAVAVIVIVIVAAAALMLLRKRKK
jgi:outer membrane protein assembly factor BamB